jgi:chromosome segregation protein
MAGRGQLEGGRASRWRSMSRRLGARGGTALGDYLEAVCVEALEDASGALERLSSGRITLIEQRAAAGAADAATLGARVAGPAAVRAQLATVLTAASLPEALHRRGSLAHGQSLITREGEWVGRDWLRVSRGPDQRAGVLAREHRLKAAPHGTECQQRAVSAENALATARRLSAEAAREVLRPAARRSSAADAAGAARPARRAEGASARAAPGSAETEELSRERAAAEH